MLAYEEYMMHKNGISISSLNSLDNYIIASKSIEKELDNECKNIEEFNKKIVHYCIEKLYIDRMNSDKNFSLTKDKFLELKNEFESICCDPQKNLLYMLYPVFMNDEELDKINWKNIY